MPSTCIIDFENNPLKVIYAGQLLRGTVALTLTETKSVRGVYIRIRGTAYARWTSGSGRSRSTNTGKEDYLDEKTYFVGGPENTNDEVQLLPGTSHYTFECLLPSGLPSSVEGNLGHIRYTAAVVLDIPMWPDKTFDVSFTVIKAIDLNADPTLRKPVIAEANERFLPCCLLCCWVSEPLKMVARMPVGGYTPGQNINLELNVNNQSSQPVTEFIVQLLKKITYHTYANSVRHISQKSAVIEKRTRGCDINQDENILINMEVPPIPPTDLSTSNIIKVDYSIRITGTVGCCHPDPYLKLPLTIGSYPIQDILTTQTGYSYPHSNEVTGPTAPLLPTSNVISQQPMAPIYSNQNNYSTEPYPTAQNAAFQFPNDDPPTYEEAVQDPADTNFKPKYPMFKRTTSYSSGN